MANYLAYGIMRENKYNKLIAEIIKFKEAVEDIDNTRLPHKLVGELGEFYVIKKLQSMGFSKIVHKGGHSRYDILLGNENLRIEVRTSLLKNEGIYPKGINFFGWKIKTKGQKDEQPFDILIGVALPESFKKPTFYIFTHQETEKLDTISGGRFSNIKTKIHLFKDTETLMNALKAKPALVTKFERYINKYPEKFINRWDKIRTHNKSILQMV
jgi:hypothetical protein